MEGGSSTVDLHGTFGFRRVAWHSSSDIGSAAFWIDQARRSSYPASPRIADSLAHEVAACLLGGHGVSGEMTMAAFLALRQTGLLDDPNVTRDALESVLREPLHVGANGSRRRYRFPSQRADRLSIALPAVHARVGVGWTPETLRSWLLCLPGIGMKTASWIARNTLDADELAVVDIHVHRAGLVAGVFDPTWSLARNYLHLESAFCAWAQAGGVSAWQLDSCIWNQLAAAARRGVRLDSAIT